MGKWEHIVVQFDNERAQEELDSYSAEGWELVSVIPHGWIENTSYSYEGPALALIPPSNYLSKSGGEAVVKTILAFFKRPRQE